MTYLAPDAYEFPPVPIITLLTPVDMFEKTSLDQHLGVALGSIQSSHEPVLVFDNDIFVGVVSLTAVFFEKRLPRLTKTAHHLIPLPQLHTTDDLFVFIRTMLDTRLYALPVRDDDQLAGVLEVAKIFTWMVDQPAWFSLLEHTVQSKIPITVTKGALAGEVYRLLKSERLSRVVVVDGEGKMIGLVTRNDMRNTFLSPTPKQRFAAPVRGQRNSFDPMEKTMWENTPVQLMMKKEVYSFPQSTMQTMLRELITSDYNSAVILDKSGRPVGILSNRDILEGLWRLRPDDFRLGRHQRHKRH